MAARATPDVPRLVTKHHRQFLQFHSLYAKGLACRPVGPNAIAPEPAAKNSHLAPCCS
jgi:hypothetical protein